MSERNYYVICDDNCKFEGMTKEQVYDAIAQATGHTPTPVDEAFITKIKEQNGNLNTKLWIGTNAEYNELTEKQPDTVYLVLDAVTEFERLEAEINELKPIQKTVALEGYADFTGTAVAEMTYIPSETEQGQKQWLIVVDIHIRGYSNEYSVPAEFDFPAEFSDLNIGILPCGDTNEFICSPEDEGTPVEIYKAKIVNGSLKLYSDQDEDRELVLGYLMVGSPAHDIWLHTVLHKSR